MLHRSWQTGIKAIPIVVDDKVIAMSFMGDALRQSEKDTQPLYWKRIKSSTLKRIIGDKKKILLSSTAGALKGFWERFTNDFDITVFEESLLYDYLYGKYDILIYGADVWPTGAAAKYQVKELYADLLMEEVYHYLKTNSVAYHYFDLAKDSTVKNIGMRVISQGTTMILAPASVLSGTRNDYVSFLDTNGNETYHFVGGRRMTTDAPEIYKQSIYFLGPCTVWGPFAYKDEETISSRLQRKINSIYPGYRVENYGSTAADVVYAGIDQLYRLLDLKLKTGDIVIHFGNAFFIVNAEIKST